jgi:integrase
MASIDKRSRTSWRARVRIPGHDDKTRSFNTRTEAQEWARITEAQLRNGVDTIPDAAAEPTLAQALDWYLEQETPKKKGREQETRRIRAWKARELTKLKLSQLTPMHFVEFRKQREAEGCAGNTIRLDLSLISNLFKAARLDWGMPYLDNPIALLRKPKQGKGRDRRLSADEAKRFERALEACPKKLVRLAVLFAIHTAARQGEILRLKRTDVDFGRRIAIFRDTKNGEDRAVPLSKHALAVLRQLDTSAESPVMFPVTRTVITRAWRHILERAGIKDFRFHDLRHEATTSLFERGLSTMEVQKVTGHKTLAMLLRYTQMDVGHLVERLDATESSPRPPGNTVRSDDAVGASGASTVPEIDQGTTLPSNVIPFMSRNRPG